MSEQDRIQARYRERDGSAQLSGFWTLANPVVLHLAQERERAVLAALARHGVNLAAARLLDVGCGAGGEFANYLRWGLPLAGLFGVDLTLPRLQAAQRAVGPRVAQASGAALPFAGGSFDVVAQNVVFSSIISSPMRQQVAQEMLRVLRPGGCLLWYDAACTRGSDPHFRNVPLDELQTLFPDLPFTVQKLTTDLGLLKRVHAAFGQRGLALMDLTGLFKTHLLAVGKKT